MGGGTIAAIIIGIIILCLLIGLLSYFVIYPAIAGEGDESTPLTQTTAEAAQIAAASAEQLANQAKLAATPQAASEAAAQANNAAIQAQATAKALAAQSQAANSAAQAAMSAAQANPTAPELLTAQTAALAAQTTAKAAADAAAAAAAKAKTQAEAAQVFANQKLNQQASSGNNFPVAPGSTKAQDDQAAAAAQEAIAARDAEENAKDTTTPATPTTETAASTPAPAEDFTKLCKDNSIKAQQFFTKKITSSDFAEGKFLPELKKYPSGSRQIDLIRKDDVSYNPTTKECVYNVRPFGYVPSSSGPPTAEFLPRRRVTIPVATVKGF